MARRLEPGIAWRAYRDSHAALREWLAAVPAQRWADASILPGWTIADLAAHVGRVADSIAAIDVAPRGARTATVAEYLGSYAAAAATIADTARDIATENDHQPERILATLDARLAAATATIERIGPRDRVIQARRGPIRLSDFLVTRVIEVVIHADDFALSRPDLPPPALPDDATRITVRALLDVLAERVPGRSVEVRVPPIAAIQCVEGPRHTRGTPPGVVEMSPGVWLRLAAGRADWAQEVADGSVVASGERASLAPYLPVL